MRAVLVRPGAEPELVEVTPTLDELQRHVGGDIEAIGGHDPGDKGWCAYLNENGKIIGLPRNPVGERLAKSLGWIGFPDDYLVGPLLFLGGPDGYGDNTDVPAGVVFAAGLE